MRVVLFVEQATLGVVAASALEHWAAEPTAASVLLIVAAVVLHSELPVAATLEPASSLTLPPTAEQTVRLAAHFQLRPVARTVLLDSVPVEPAA